ncbi:MAG: DUF6089 family protein [Bacteroidetes bacterium]|nr:DUF6089 family protein [Bacteroidota bacterium]
MRRLTIYLFFTCLLTSRANAQYVQLVENRGEIGVFQGVSSFRGDIAPGVYNPQPTYGAFYKKLVNDYIGFRLNYEKITLQANDNLSTNAYAINRGLSFERVSHDASVMMELYFLKFIDGYNDYRFFPYLSFGVGAWKSISGYLANNIPMPAEFLEAKTIRTITYPINLGLKYNVIGPINVFGEASYRFTNSDQIDYFGDNELQNGLQPSASGRDQYFSLKFGLSYNIKKTYGPDKQYNEKKKTIFGIDEPDDKTSAQKGFLSLFKRK